VSAKLAESAKALVMTKHKHICSVSKNLMSQQWMSWFSDVLWPDADQLFIACGLWPASGFIGSGNGAHFDRCAYIIDSTLYWFIEYTFSRESSNSC